MLDTALIGAELKHRGFDFYSGVPCSFLKSLINYAINHVEYVAAANEGDAVAIATGAYAGGRKAVVLMQNSGLTNATSPLASLNAIFKLPVLGFVSLRGEPGVADEPQHELMGVATTEMLDALRICWEYLATDADGAAAQIARADRAIAEKRTFFFVVRKDTFGPEKLLPQPTRLTADKRVESEPGSSTKRPTRRQALEAIIESATPGGVLMATTGFTGRELYEIRDHESHFYMVGSMGCASSMGLGLAIAQPTRDIIVIDGDGAALMRLGALATNGYYAPPNLLHVLLDNGTHESTGAQFTVSPNVNWAEVASACGYPSSFAVGTLDALRRRIGDWEREPRLTFLSLQTATGVPDTLSRPSVTPPEVAERLMRYLGTAH